MFPIYFIWLLSVTTMTLGNPVPVTTNNQGNINQIENINKLTDFKDKRVDVVTTIQQVQDLLNNDPNLPRLTKGEIEDLFEQVTKEEYEKSLQAGDITRANHMRALMLVLPYNTENHSEQDLQELFNRPPVTKVIPTNGERKPPKPQQTFVVPTGKVEIISIGNAHMQPTTYKPTFRRKFTTEPDTPITTYHPGQPFARTDKYEIITIAHNEPLAQFITTVDQPSDLIEIENIATERPVRFSSHYNAKNTDFKTDQHTNTNNDDSKVSEKPTTTTPKSDMSRELDDVLTSLGFTAKAQARRRVKHHDYSDFELPKPVLSSIIKQDRVSVDEFEPVAVKIEDFTKALVPRTKPDDFVAFKPLNIRQADQIEPEIEDYLVKFGLVGGRTRSEKSIHSPPLIEKINVPQTSTTKRTRTSSITTIKPHFVQKRIDTNIDDSLVNNAFNTNAADNNDFEQLTKLLKNLRELQELKINLTADNFKQLDLNNYNLSDSLLGQGPDPLDIPEYADLRKNEVKRQQPDNPEPIRFDLDLNLESDSDLPADKKSNNNDESLTTTSSSPLTGEIEPTSTSATTTTEESQNGAISDLEDSFGKLDPVTEEPLPPPRKNGFYFLADINSFLEVGDGEEKVLVRFNPKIGDPSRFISVKVP